MHDLHIKTIEVDVDKEKNSSLLRIYKTNMGLDNTITVPAAACRQITCKQLKYKLKRERSWTRTAPPHVTVLPLTNPSFLTLFNQWYNRIYGMNWTKNVKMLYLEKTKNINLTLHTCWVNLEPGFSMLQLRFHPIATLNITLFFI